MSTTQPGIVISSGEPAGIGPDLCVQLAQTPQPCPVTIIIDPDLFEQRASEMGVTLKNSSDITLLPAKLNAKVKAGHLDIANADYVLEMLDIAVQACLKKEFHAMVTAPVHKGIINEAGIPFSGHTEYLAQQCNVDEVVMMLATEGLRVALVTTHLPLADVSRAITAEKLTAVINILHQDLMQRFNIIDPKIYVCGLNPHAGEGGHLGREEIDVIEPTLENLRKQGKHLIGPLPADTLFTPRYLQQADVVLSMFHDQGLPVLKYKGFGRAVNATLGLPFIRTSVDHGTALDLAATGQIDSGSLQYAIETALQMQ
jgi:4-hydroxythreonine-4-phosphate dehydrogenase